MPLIDFTRAVRKGSPVLIALYGESNSGKTLSALLLARGLVGPQGRIGLLDTETGRALVYANEVGGWDYAELTPPFTPERYVESLADAEAAGLDCLIMDSASHEWEGLGGVLETADDSGGKGLQKWARPKARHKKFIQALLRARLHLIVSLRAKEKFIQGKNPDTGKEEIVSAGFVSVQDKRFIYDMTVQLFMHQGRDKAGYYTVEKCPRDLLGAFPDGDRISEETGRRVAEWVAGGAMIDQTYEAAKNAAEDAADEGMEALRRHWEALPQEMRDRLRTILPNLKSIASAADREREAQQQDPARPFASAAERAASGGTSAVGEPWVYTDRAGRTVPYPTADAWAGAMLVGFGSPGAASELWTRNTVMIDRAGREAPDQLDRVTAAYERATT